MLLSKLKLCVSCLQYSIGTTEMELGLSMRIEKTFFYKKNILWIKKCELC